MTFAHLLLAFALPMQPIQKMSDFKPFLGQLVAFEPPLTNLSYTFPDVHQKKFSIGIVMPNKMQRGGQMVDTYTLLMLQHRHACPDNKYNYLDTLRSEVRFFSNYYKHHKKVKLKMRILPEEEKMHIKWLVKNEGACFSGPEKKHPWIERLKLT